jgi:phospholipase C
MDGACKLSYGTPCSVGPACPNTNYAHCPQYAYVDNSTGTIQPYWQIAEDYGFANYMFQTSQGPSFPAHQFLLSGSSQPDGMHSPDYTFFAAENMGSGNNQDAGCAAATGETVLIVAPPPLPPPQNEVDSIYPCFEHPTLTDLLDNNQPSPITWRYYSDQANSIWTAPNAIAHMCNDGATGCGSGQGSNLDWNNVGPYLETANHLAPFLNDLQSCNLAQVTWVVPDGRWSDHASKSIGLGPDYVADIVNAVGGTGPPTNNCGFWNNTVILITWDDWGGWYDHVSPTGSKGPGIGYSNGSGGQYVYGFRVPLLVVSGFAKQHYVSSPIGSTLIEHDFGSILKFIEEAFLPSNTFVNPTYPYADQFAGVGQRVSDLSDFFDCLSPSCVHAFQPITLAANPQYCNNNQGGCGQTSCNAACFINYPGSPKDPDDE